MPPIWAGLLERRAALEDRAEVAADQVYKAWPAGVTHLLADTATATVRDIHRHHRQVLWAAASKRFVSFSVAMLADPSRPCAPALASAINAAGVHLVHPPDHVQESFKTAEITCRRASVDEVCALFRASSAQLAPAVSAALIQFVLYASTPIGSEYAALDGLKVIPLLGGKFGIARVGIGWRAIGKGPGKSKGAGKKGGRPRNGFGAAAGAGEHFYTHSDAALLARAFPNCPLLIDPSDQALRQKLSSKLALQILNINQVVPEVLEELMPFCLPPDWVDRQCVALAGPADGGVQLDHDGGVAPTFGSEQPKSSMSKTKLKKQQIARAKQSRKLKAAPHSELFALPPTFDEAKDRLAALWEVLWLICPGKLEDTPLQRWPTVLAEEGFCCSLEYSRLRVVLDVGKFNKVEVAVLRKFGCLFWKEHGVRDELDSAADYYSWHLGASRSKAMTALAGAISLQNSLCGDASARSELRQLVLQWTNAYSSKLRGRPDESDGMDAKAENTTDGDIGASATDDNCCDGNGDVAADAAIN